MVTRTSLNLTLTVLTSKKRKKGLHHYRPVKFAESLSRAPPSINFCVCPPDLYIGRNMQGDVVQVR